MNLDYIEQLSKVEKKRLIERMVKLQEEVGELAQEVLIETNASGSKHKSPGKDGIKGESVDVIIVALSIFFATGGNKEELSQIMQAKSERWEKFQEKEAK